MSHFIFKPTAQSRLEDLNKNINHCFTKFYANEISDKDGFERKKSSQRPGQKWVSLEVNFLKTIQHMPACKTVVKPNMMMMMLMMRKSLHYNSLLLLRSIMIVIHSILIFFINFLFLCLERINFPWITILKSKLCCHDLSWNEFHFWNWSEKKKHSVSLWLLRGEYSCSTLLCLCGIIMLSNGINLW